MISRRSWVRKLGINRYTYTRERIETMKKESVHKRNGAFDALHHRQQQKQNLLTTCTGASDVRRNHFNPVTYLKGFIDTSGTIKEFHCDGRLIKEGQPEH